jgi:hypothetical protein
MGGQFRGVVVERRRVRILRSEPPPPFRGLSKKVFFNDAKLTPTDIPLDVMDIHPLARSSRTPFLLTSCSPPPLSLSLRAKSIIDKKRKIHSNRSLLLALIVEKSKKCLDFSVTLFVIHLLLCTIYSGGFPSTWDWWIVNFTGMIIMVLLGEYLCSRKELSDIPLLVL